MWVSSWAPVVVNQREGCQQFVALPYVHSVHEQYVKLHEQHYRTYIQMIDFQMSQKALRHRTYLLCQTCILWYSHTHNLWCGDICFTIKILIDVKFPEGSFESRQFADADGRTSSLRFVRTITFPFPKKYRNIFVIFPSRDLKHKFVIFIRQLTKINSLIWLTSTIWLTVITWRSVGNSLCTA